MSLRKEIDAAFERHLNGEGKESIDADAPARISRYDFEAGYRAALNEPDWISFSEREPEHLSRVMWFTPRGCHISTHDRGGIPPCQATHWMNLPEPPNE